MKYSQLEGSYNYEFTDNENPKTLAEALLWKLGHWRAYKSFCSYYSTDNDNHTDTDLILFAFAKHLKNNSNPIVDQHTLRAALAIDISLTEEQTNSYKQFLTKSDGTWKSYGGGNSAAQCYDQYKEFIRNLSNKNIPIDMIDKLLMPLGQGIKKLVTNVTDLLSGLS